MKRLSVLLVALIGSFLMATIAGPSPALGQTNCSPAYPDFCIPPAPDVNCADLQYSDFTVLSPDPHDLDGNNRNGRGCETTGRPKAPLSAAVAGTTAQVATTAPSAASPTTSTSVQAPRGSGASGAVTPTTRSPLVNTGSSTGPMSATGAGFVLLGAVLVRAAYKRRINGPYRIRYR